MRQPQDDMVPIVIDLNIAKSGEINEGFLTMFGSTIKYLLGQMFGMSPRGYGSTGPHANDVVKIRGTRSQVNSFADTLQKEKAYIRSYQKHGLDDPKTFRNKGRLKSSIAKFERDTGIKWPFK